jgi:hypothetical protein
MISRPLSAPILIAIILLFSALASPFVLSADPPVPLRMDLDFEVRYWGEDNDYVTDMVLSNNSLYLTGHAEKVGKEDLLLLCYDTSGEPQWNLTIHRSMNILGNSIAADEEGGIYVAGSLGRDLLLMKFSSNGTMLWEETWHAWDDEAVAVDAYNGSVYVLGVTHNMFHTINDLVLLKYDYSGNLIWNVSWSGKGTAQAVDIMVMGGNVYAVCTTQGINSQSKAIGLLKFGSDGVMAWNRSLSAPHNEEVYALAGDGDYVYMLGEYGYTTVIFKYSKAGNWIWERTWGGENDDRARDMVFYNHTLYVSGETSDGATPDQYGHVDEPDLVFLEFSQFGQLNSSMAWGMGAREEGTALVVSDEGMFIAGNNQEIGDYDWDIFLIGVKGAIPPEEPPTWLEENLFYMLLAITPSVIVLVAAVLYWIKIR